MEFKWKLFDSIKPMCTQRGDWDGKKSDKILIRDYKGEYKIATCYDVIINGYHCFDLYDDKDFEITSEVILWTYIPEP